MSGVLFLNKGDCKNLEIDEFCDSHGVGGQAVSAPSMIVEPHGTLRFGDQLSVLRVFQ